MDNLTIAIDGPGGAGKSSIAKELAKILNIEYIDTGAMYRAIAYKMIENNVSVNDLGKVEYILGSTFVDFRGGKIYLDGKDVSHLIRSPEISMAASRFSQLASVREKLVSIQKKLAEEKSLVMDGRDIGTNVIPRAKYKFYLTASPEERARRRCVQLEEKGETFVYDHILDDIKKRDYSDMTRKLNPLKKAEDAILVDTTNMDFAQSLDFIISKIKK